MNNRLPCRRVHTPQWWASISTAVCFLGELYRYDREVIGALSLPQQTPEEIAAAFGADSDD